MQFWVSLAGISGALSIVAGAFGAHALRARLGADLLATWQTAAHYHQVHSVALLALALFAASSGRSILLPGVLLAAGTLIFCGSLYFLALSGPRWLGPVTPFGGLLLIAGWLSLLTLLRD